MRASIVRRRNQATIAMELAGVLSNPEAEASLQRLLRARDVMAPTEMGDYAASFET
jgi:hypothetical protein